MTTDADGAKAFYDAVVGWNIESRSNFPNGYRMVGRSDGKSAGGVLPLTDEMRQHGARPTWLGYLHVDDVDASVASIEQAGGKTFMAPFDIPNVGRVAMVADPQGAPFYIMKPIPPANEPNAKSDVFSADQPQHVRWNELSTHRSRRGHRLLRRPVRLGPGGRHGYGRDGQVSLHPARRHDHRRGHAQAAPTVRLLWTYYIGVDDIDRAAEAIKAGSGQILNGPMEIPGGEFALNAIDPQGAPFGLVGPRK